MIPRPYQSRAIGRAKAALEQHGNTLLVAPTGAGKTIMMGQLTKEMQPAKTLVIQHREELVDQNLAKFRKISPSTPVSLYTATAKSWRGQVTFAMVQTLAKERNLATIPRLDLVLVDEAHHIAAQSYKKILRVVRDINPDCAIGGFTATPMRGDKKGLRRYFDNVADQITIKELIDRGFLVPPRAFVVDVAGVREGLSKVRKLTYDFDMEEVEKVMNQRVVNDEVLNQWREHAGDRRTIVFCSTVAHAGDVQAAFRSAGIAAEMITGESTRGERAGVIRRMKEGETQVLVNVAVLTEGFDEPSISCVVLLRPCSQKGTMIQMIGRGLRTINPAEYPVLRKRDCVVLDFGSSILTHGNVETSADLGSVDGDEKREAGNAPFKVCPELPGEIYAVPDSAGRHGCGAEVPASVKACPLCGFTFEPKAGQEEAQEVVLTEIDLLNASPFRWVDLFGSGKVMMASGFEAWAGVFSADEESWFAIGKARSEKVLSCLNIGDKTVSLAAADDFLRNNESSDSAQKSRRWLRDPASQKQLELLTQVGYQIDPLGFAFTKYSATSHLNFQWNKHSIERILFGGAN